MFKITSKSVWSFLAICLLYFSGHRPVCADTVIMNDGEMLKGVVVEEYNDRIVISTVDGEQEVLRGDIRKVVYDLEEQNLTNLGDFYEDRGLYREAYYYYNKALEINPDYKKAREGLHYAGSHIQQTGRMKKLNHIQKLNEHTKWEKGITTSEHQSLEDKIKHDLGISLVNKKGSFEISYVVPGSPAAKVGIHRGDVLLEVWGRAIGYMRPGEVLEKLASPGVMDMQATFSRRVSLRLPDASGNYDALLGARLGFSEMEGLVVEEIYPKGVAAAAGMKVKDVITRIQGQSTRYMPMGEVARNIRSRRGETLVLDIKRDFILWKKF